MGLNNKLQYNISQSYNHAVNMTSMILQLLSYFHGPTVFILTGFHCITSMLLCFFVIEGLENDVT